MVFYIINKTKTCDSNFEVNIFQFLKDSTNETCTLHSQYELG